MGVFAVIHVQVVNRKIADCAFVIACKHQFVGHFFQHPRKISQVAEQQCRFTDVACHIYRIDKFVVCTGAVVVETQIEVDM